MRDSHHRCEVGTKLDGVNPCSKCRAGPGERCRVAAYRDDLELTRLREIVAAAFTEQRDPIPDSDLDNEQPISLTIRLTLGDARKADVALRKLKAA